MFVSSYWLLIEKKHTPQGPAVDYVDMMLRLWIPSSIVCSYVYNREYIHCLDHISVLRWLPTL